VDTAAFLRHILPTEGFKCITIKSERGYFNRFFDTHEQAAAFALQQDAAACTVYFACATFTTAATRKQVNAAYLKSLFADVDVGDGKPYKTRAEASAALTDFLIATGLPPPTVVHSGPRGLHLYWVLDEELPPDEWKPYALALRALCARHRFHIDPARIVDTSSVLRPIGTHNRKHELTHPVTVAHVAPPVALDELPLRPVKEQPHQPRLGQRRLFEGAAAYGDVPSDANKVADGCAQISHLRDMKGDVEYYEWLFAIWTLRHTSQGAAICHEWSIAHPHYSPEETQRKLDENREPITCGKFHEHSPARCEACKYWGQLSSPIELGRASQHAGINGIEIAGSWSNDANGLFFNFEGKGGVPAQTMVSRVPIVFKDMYRGERATDTWSLRLEMDLPKLGPVPLLIPSGTLFSTQGMPELARMGVVVHEPDLMRKYLRQQMDAYNQAHAPQTRFDQFGWKDHDNAFLFGSKLYTQTQILASTGSPEIERRARLLGARGGTLAAWTSAANQLFAKGCEPHSFALCCSFGATLMRFHSEEGGAIVNLVSEQSATGKTTGLEAVASVWGQMDGLRLTDEDTKVSRGLLLGTLGNLPCVFDELHKRDPDTVRQFCIMFTNGRDKLRARSDGTLRDPSGDWQTILVLGSNLSLVDILQAKVTEEAQAYRVLEFIAEQNFSNADGDKLRRALKDNAGHAGDAFLRYLLSPGMLETVKGELERAVHSLYHHPDYGFDKKHRFWVRAIACAFVAARIVNKLDILNFDVDRVIDWAIVQCKERQHTEVPHDHAHALNEMLYDLWASTMVVDTDWRGPKNSCQVLSEPIKGFHARRVRETGRMYISRSWARTWLSEHLVNRSSFFKELLKRHIIVNENKFVNLGAGTPRNIGGQIMCLEIDMHHPAMMDAVLASERDVSPEERAKRPLATLLQFPRAGASSPSPPPPSQ
jgi:hypothetical protein